MNSYELHLARHHLSLVHQQPHPRQTYDAAYDAAETLPLDLLTPLADALERESQLRMRDPAYDPEWFAVPGNRRKVHPHQRALWRGEPNPATDARVAAAAACWAWLAQSHQLELFAATP